MVVYSAQDYFSTVPKLLMFRALHFANVEKLMRVLLLQNSRCSSLRDCWRRDAPFPVVSLTSFLSGRGVAISSKKLVSDASAFLSHLIGSLPPDIMLLHITSIDAEQRGSIPERAGSLHDIQQHTSGHSVCCWCFSFQTAHKVDEDASLFLLVAAAGTSLEQTLLSWRSLVN